MEGRYDRINRATESQRGSWMPPPRRDKIKKQLVAGCWAATAAFCCCGARSRTSEAPEVEDEKAMAEESFANEGVLPGGQGEYERGRRDHGADDCQVRQEPPGRRERGGVLESGQSGEQQEREGGVHEGRDGGGAPHVAADPDQSAYVGEFFRHGQCAKGFKCKYSRDLSVERKGEKIDIYSDQRDGEGTMDEWDQETLKKVVAAKGNEFIHNKPTEIVCKHFLDAVERKQYGWFWACPNGGKECHYRHALPPGYVLESQMKALLEEEGEKLTIDEEIENQRHIITRGTLFLLNGYARGYRDPWPSTGDGLIQVQLLPWILTGSIVNERVLFLV